jgi:hypothetical protein
VVIYINQKRGNNSRKKAGSWVSADISDQGEWFQKNAEKRFWYVSSMKQKNGCGDMADCGMVNFEKGNHWVAQFLWADFLKWC